MKLLSIWILLDFRTRTPFLNRPHTSRYDDSFTFSKG